MAVQHGGICLGETLKIVLSKLSDQFLLTSGVVLGNYGSLCYVQWFWLFFEPKHFS